MFDCRCGQNGDSHVRIAVELRWFHRQYLAEKITMKRISEGVGFRLHFHGSANAWQAEMNL
jgi:hypothetical protein